MKILVIGEENRFTRYSNPLFLEKHQITIVPIGTSNKTIESQCKNARILIVDPIAEVNADLINRLPRLRLIQSEGVAYNHIDLKAASRRGINVCHCRGFNTKAVAEQAILLMLGCLRDVVKSHNDVINGHQIDNKFSHMVNGDLIELGECSVGLLGCGAIAKNVAKILNGFGTKVYYYDIKKQHMITEQFYNLTYLPLNELLTKCDIISLHVPLTTDTHHIVNNEFIKQMKKGSLLINTAHGELIDNQALIRALETKHIRCAGLDTLDHEPIQKDHELLTSHVSNQILYSPHTAGLTASAFDRAYKIIWDNINHIQHHEKPDFIINE